MADMAVLRPERHSILATLSRVSVYHGTPLCTPAVKWITILPRSDLDHTVCRGSAHVRSSAQMSDLSRTWQ